MTETLFAFPNQPFNQSPFCMSVVRNTLPKYSVLTKIMRSLIIVVIFGN